MVSAQQEQDFYNIVKCLYFVCEFADDLTPLRDVWGQPPRDDPFCWDVRRMNDHILHKLGEPQLDHKDAWESHLTKTRRSNFLQSIRDHYDRAVAHQLSLRAADNASV